MNRPARAALVVAAVVFGAAAVGAVAGALTYALRSEDGRSAVSAVGRDSQLAAVNGLSVGGVYDFAHRGVVEITATIVAKPPLAPERQQAQGSGWVYDSQGHVVTNEHVVEDADTISVRFWNGAVSSATLTGSDSQTDLGVVKVAAPSSLLYPLRIGDSGALHVGDEVVVIGSPFGLEQTVTSGIVSALHREIEALNGSRVRGAIQTDAAINGGSSGSPLLDKEGNVVGVAAKIESDSGGNDGVAFAIPADAVASTVPRLISRGS